MENLINCPGLHHVVEEIFLNLTLNKATLKSLEDCKKVNKSWELILKNPLLVKSIEKRKNSPWFWFRSCLQHEKFGNKSAWKEAIQKRVGTHHEKRLNQLLEKLYEHLEMCRTKLNWCCMNMNNKFLCHFLDCPEFHELHEGCQFTSLLDDDDNDDDDDLFITSMVSHRKF